MSITYNIFEGETILGPQAEALTYVYDNRKNSEVEARFGRAFFDKKGESKFTSKLFEGYKFQRALDYITTNGGVISKFEQWSYPARIRYRKYLKNPLGLEDEGWSQKLPGNSKIISDYNIKLSTAVENKKVAHFDLSLIDDLEIKDLLSNINQNFKLDDNTELATSLKNVSNRHVEVTRYSCFNSTRSIRIDLSKILYLENQEIEHQLELEIIDSEALRNLDFDKMLIIMFKVIHFSDYLYTYKELSSFRNTINLILGGEPNKKYIDRKYFNDSRNLKSEDLISGGIIDNSATIYKITDKADGYRRILSADETGLWMFFNDDFNLLYRKSNMIIGMICEGEYIPKERRRTREDGSYIDKNHAQRHVIYLYDFLSISNDNHSDILGDTSIQILPHIQRLGHAREFAANHTKLVDLYISVKSFTPLTKRQFFYQVTNLLDNLPNYPYETDGLMFIPEKMPYDYWLIRDLPDIRKRVLTKMYDICKWKPSHDLTLDLMYWQGKLYFDSAKNEDIVQDKNEFKGSKFYPRIQLDPKIENYDSGDVIEFRVKDDVLVPVRHRWDKLRPNRKNIAIDNWDLAHRPINESTLRGDDAILMFRYHNTIKKQLLYSLEKDSTLLDIGSGPGGTVHLWGNFKHVVAVEPNTEYINDREENGKLIAGLKTRLSTTGYQDKVTIINASGTDSQLITNVVNQNIIGSKVDYVTLMLSATFFWKDENMLRDLATTIKNNLKPDGKVVFLTMDGDAVWQAFHPALNPHLDIEIFSLDSLPFRLEGRTIHINLIESFTVHEQIEYLAFMDDLALLLNGTLTKYRADKENLLPDIYKFMSAMYSYGYISINNEDINIRSVELDLLPKIESSIESPGAPPSILLDRFLEQKKDRLNLTSVPALDQDNISLVARNENGEIYRLPSKTQNSSIFEAILNLTSDNFKHRNNEDIYLKNVHQFRTYLANYSLTLRENIYLSTSYLLQFMWINAKINAWVNETSSWVSEVVMSNKGLANLFNSEAYIPEYLFQVIANSLDVNLAVYTLSENPIVLSPTIMYVSSLKNPSLMILRSHRDSQNIYEAMIVKINDKFINTINYGDPHAKFEFDAFYDQDPDLMIHKLCLYLKRAYQFLQDRNDPNDEEANIRAFYRLWAPILISKPDATIWPVINKIIGSDVWTLSERKLLTSLFPIA